MESNGLSTYDELVQDPKRRERFEEEYQRLVLVEVLIPLLEKTEISVRVLAKMAGLSPTVIQDIKSGKKEGISYSTFLSILEALGYKANIRITKVRQPKAKALPRRKKSRVPLSRRRKSSAGSRK
jgi:DNA-binding Xre family transcriptional regulator